MDPLDNDLSDILRIKDPPTFKTEHSLFLMFRDGSRKFDMRRFDRQDARIGMEESQSDRVFNALVDDAVHSGRHVERRVLLMHELGAGRGHPQIQRAVALLE